MVDAAPDQNPVHGGWGEHDAGLPGSPLNLTQFFCDLIPTAVQQVQVQGAGHFLQEDRGELLASEVLKIQT